MKFKIILGIIVILIVVSSCSGEKSSSPIIEKSYKQLSDSLVNKEVSEDECKFEGLKECYNAESFRICEYYDQVMGLDWSEIIKCSDGYVCKEGGCVLESENIFKEIEKEVSASDVVSNEDVSERDIPVSDKNVSSKRKCPEGFILDSADVSYRTNTNICKPKIFDLIAPDDINYYLSDELYWVTRIWNDWRTYPPLVNKVNELITGKTSDVEKVRAIANWVHKSKNYNGSVLYVNDRRYSPAHLEKDFSVIFNSDTGVCLDAAIITSVMLRAAGIPAIHNVISMNHIVTMYFIDELWYSVDTTFCFDKNNCPDLTFMSVEEARNQIYFLNNKEGAHFRTDRNGYCEDTKCLDSSFVTNEIMPLNDKSRQAVLIYPALRNTYIGNNQIFCSLKFEDMLCGADGCHFSSIPVVFEGRDDSADRWDKIIRLQLEIQDMRNIGYLRVLLPASFISSQPYSEKVINYRFVCKQIIPTYRLIAYKEFTLSPDTELVVRYEELVKARDATNQEFNELKNKLKAITDDLNINP